ncbi:MAG: polysaccharide deacetylase family protein [Proteobacteria bacterium]|nr:polysaccharide deacetylase family protein [Pseudomonadota bacterium]
MPASLTSAEPAAPRWWSATPLMRGSLVLHGAAAVAVAAHPPVWPWALGAVALDHVGIAAAGLTPRSRLLGANLTHLPAAATPPCVALTLDDGPDAQVTPQVLEILARERVRATFFCVGAHVRREPALTREILAGGHCVENHTERHLKRFSLLGPRAMADEVARAQATIAGVTGVSPRFFRAPAGLRNPFLGPVLAREQLRLVSWTRRGLDTVSHDPHKVLARLTRRLAGGDILLIHDGHDTRRSRGTPAVLEVLPRLLEHVRRAGLMPVTLRDATAGTGSP